MKPLLNSEIDDPTTSYIVFLKLMSLTTSYLVFLSYIVLLSFHNEKLSWRHFWKYSVCRCPVFVTATNESTSQYSETWWKHTLRKLAFHFLSNWMGYDHGDSFPFNFGPNGFPFASRSKGKLSSRSYPIQFDSKWKTSFLSVTHFIYQVLSCIPHHD